MLEHIIGQILVPPLFESVWKEEKTTLQIKFD